MLQNLLCVKGAIAGGSAASAAAGAGLAGGTAAASGTTALGIMSGPVGWVVLGADEDGLKWDCWKKVDI